MAITKKTKAEIQELLEQKNLYEVYPDGNWDTKKWGEPPLLGQVYADDAFSAERKAYDKKLLRMNFTFGVKVKLVREGKKVAKAA